MSELVPCAGCGRHVRQGEPSCPFCAAPTGDAPEPALPDDMVMALTYGPPPWADGPPGPSLLEPAKEPGGSRWRAVAAVALGLLLLIAAAYALLA